MFILIGIAQLNGFNVKRNSIIGYRTRRSMRCVRSWGWAQNMLGEYLLTDGAVLAAASPVIFTVLYFIMKGSELSQNIGTAILLLQVLTLLPVMLKIEYNLKKEQDRWEIR